MAFPAGTPATLRAYRTIGNTTWSSDLTIMARPITNAKTSKRRSRNNRTNNSPSDYRNTRVANIGNLFPDRVITKMRYAAVLSRAPAVSVVDEYQFNINDTFDPDRTGGGHQPMGRDQLLGNLYNKYKVHSCGYRVQMNTVMTDAAVLYVGVSNDMTAVNGTLTNPSEQPMFMTKLVPYTSNGTGAQSTEFRGKVNIWDVLGRTKQQYLSDDITGANYNAQPVETAVLKIGIMSAGATAYVIWSALVELDMLVECYDRFTQPQS